MRLLAASGLMLSMAMAGCVSTNYTYGKPIQTEKVALIKKGETTTTQIFKWFGEPGLKTVVSDNETKWMYFYKEGKAKAHAFTGAVESQGTSETLDLFVRDDIVVNFAHTISDEPMTQTGARFGDRQSE